MSRSPLPRRLLERMSSYPKFYRKVWLACARIPRGETRTYGEIARAVGSPRSARAVGQALARNPFAPDVPCHRVVRSDGGLGGYSGPGGVRAKRKILERESRGKGGRSLLDRPSN